MDQQPSGRGRVAILLSTYNGARYLSEQLESLLAQSHADWELFWRDDGSSDATRALLRAFAAGPGAGRCRELPGNAHLGVTRSFLTLLRAAQASEARWFAFADQDDVWLPQKLTRGVAALGALSGDRPALYCAGQILVDAQLRRLGRSTPPRRPPGFPAALTQNIVTGCTMMLDRAAAAQVLNSAPPAMTLHDWWSYLVVAGGGGLVLTDAEPVILYRQHEGNLVGAPHGSLRRGIAALRRGPGVFMRAMRFHVAALEAQPHLLSAQARRDLEVIAAGLRGDAAARRAALAVPGFRRQTWQENLVFRLWFRLG